MTGVVVKNVIELNGMAERVELLLLTAMAPLWLILFPLIGLMTLPSYAGVTLLGASFFCFLHFCHVKNSHFSFEENGIRLPGVDHRLQPYANLKRIYLERPYLLAIEFVRHRSLFKAKVESAEPVVQLFEIRNLTDKSALQLWDLISKNLNGCVISPDVHDKLVDWKPDTRTQWSIKAPKKIWNVLQYLVSHSYGLCKIWLTFWIVGAFIAYPIGFACLSNQHAATQLIAAIALHCPHPVREWVIWRISIDRAQTIEQERQFWAFLFGTPQGLFCLVLFLCFYIALIYFAVKLGRRHMRQHSQ